YEPWHFRYVGKEAATAIMSQGITLEEFLEDL
ncbi:MAG: D-alanyl-D-alanine carboxypeptidase family protein, partial [Lachnospiraceae bacterium]